MTGRFLRSIAAAAAALVLSAGAAYAQAPVLAQPTTSGNNVTFTWSATAGATGYRVDYGVASGSYLGGLPVGNVTSYSVGAPNGNFFVRVVAQTAGGDVPSNEVNFRVPSPPSAPTNLTVARNGTGLVAAWTPGAGGAIVDYYQIQIGTAPGGTIAAFNVNNAGWGFPAGVPPGTYFARAVAVSNTAGASAPSNEFQVVMPAGGACDPAISDFQAQAFSGILSLSWTPIAGVSNFLSASSDVGVAAPEGPAPANGRLNIGSNQGLPFGNYSVTMRTVFACGTQSTTTQTVNNNGAPPAGTRSANPAAGQLLNVPNYLATVVTQVANARPDLLRNSCVETGGNNRFMFETIKALRALDNRWGNNIKRGNQGLSQDIVEYNRSALPDEGATTGPTTATLNVSLFDIIGGHCGGNPGVNYADVTGATVNAGARAVWTLIYYLDAGYKP